MNWYYLDQSGEVRGPVSEQAVRELIAAGAFTETTPICPEGSQEWTTFATAFRRDHTRVGQSASKPVTNSTFRTKIRNMPPALKIGAIIAVVVVGLGFVGLLGLFAVVGAVNQAVKTTGGGQANQSAQSAPLDPVASMEEEFGLKLDRDTAYIYVMGYQCGSKGASAMAGLETPQPGFDQLAITAVLNSPDLSPSQRKLAEAGVNDGKSGRPNRLGGIDIESLERAPIERTLSNYCALGNMPKVIQMATQSNVNEADEFDDLPLHNACYNGHIEIVRHLLKLGAKIDISDSSGYYPIHLAASNGNLELFILLLQAGAKFDQKTDKPHSRTDSQTSRLYRSTGAEPNPNDGKQPIHCAAAGGSYAICQYLLKNGVKADAKDNNGHTPLQYATDYVVHGEMRWYPSNAETIRLFDPNGSVESKFRKAVGANGRSIRTGGIYLRIFENTGEYMIKNGGAWNAHCLELGEDYSARFMIATVDKEPQPSDIIRAFRAPAEGAIYNGSYTLSGDNLDFLRVELHPLPDKRFEVLKGIAHGSSLELKFMSRDDDLQDRFFGKSTDSDGEGTYGHAFKFYPE
jgi:hypothetical protein